MLAQLDRTGEDQISLTDPDSRAMAARTKVGVGYNIQVAVDAKNKLIVEQAVTNQVVDMGLLTQTAEPSREVLGVETIDVVADRGYFKIEDIAACEKTARVPHVAKPQRGSSVREGETRQASGSRRSKPRDLPSPTGAVDAVRHAAADRGSGERRARIGFIKSTGRSSASSARCRFPSAACHRRGGRRRANTMGRPGLNRSKDAGWGGAGRPGNVEVRTPDCERLAGVRIPSIGGTGPLQAREFYRSSHITSATCGRADSAVQCDEVVASSHRGCDRDFRHNWRAMGSGSMLTAAHQEASSP